MKAFKNWYKWLNTPEKEVGKLRIKLNNPLIRTVKLLTEQDMLLIEADKFFATYRQTPMRNQQAFH